MLRKQIESQERELEKLRTTTALKLQKTTQQYAELSTLKMDNQKLSSQVSILMQIVDLHPVSSKDLLKK